MHLCYYYAVPMTEKFDYGPFLGEASGEKYRNRRDTELKWRREIWGLPAEGCTIEGKNW